MRDHEWRDLFNHIRTEMLTRALGDLDAAILERLGREELSIEDAYGRDLVMGYLTYLQNGLAWLSNAPVERTLRTFNEVLDLGVEDIVVINDDIGKVASDRDEMSLRDLPDFSEFRLGIAALYTRLQASD